MGPFLASRTRSSGVKSRNRRFGSGGRSIWPGVGWPFGVLMPTPMPDLWNGNVFQGARANHNPPATSRAAIARKCFRFIGIAGLLLLPRHCARFCGGWLSIWNERGEFWCEAPASRNESGPKPTGASPNGSEARSSPTDGHWVRNRGEQEGTLGI